MDCLKEISKYYNVINRILNGISAFIMLIIGFIVTYEVIMRFVFKHPTGWTLDFVPYLVLWGTFLSAAITLRKERHIKVDLLTRRLSPRKQKILEIFTESIAIVFCGILCVKGIEMVIQTKQLGIFDASSLRIPLFIPQICVPIGALLLLIEFAVRMVRNVVSLKIGKVNEEGGEIS
jgi:C4-dicarboxylate transporter DctQ subunit